MPQQALDGVPDGPWDVLIAGAGPAGATAAFRLASRGHRVLLADKARFPREKVCGDGLMFDSIRCLDDLGLYERVRAMAHEVRAMSAFSPSRVEVQAEARLLVLKRIRLDALLAEAAVGAGATFCHGHVHDLAAEPDGTVAAAFAGSDRRVRARLALVATGASLALARRAAAAPLPPPNSVAVRRYMRSSFALDQAVTFYAPWLVPGYAWIFPMGADEYNVGCVEFRPHGRGRRTNLRRALERVAETLPLARDLMRGATRVGPLRGATARCGLEGASPLLGDSILATGETAGTTLPLTGEGIGTAMTSGKLAASAIHDALISGSLDALLEYPRRLGERLRPQQLAYAASQRLAAVRWLNDLIARRATRRRLVHGIVRHVTADGADTRAVAFLKRVFRTLAVVRARPS